MAIIQDWFPPTRQNWELVVLVFRITYPLIALLQIPVSWYAMGKTSVDSIFNLPGRVGWMAMEAPGFLTLMYMMRTLPGQHGIEDLPWQNRVLAGLFVIHYLYRAVVFPIIQPSMSPIHAGVALMALTFQVLNGISLGGWLAAYGPVTPEAWTRQSSVAQFVLGIAVFYAGLAANFFHDEELREIRRAEQRRRQRVLGDHNGTTTTTTTTTTAAAAAAAVAVDKHYQIPQAGLFRHVLYAHYLCEWVEWSGFLVAAGLTSVPAWTFLINEVCAMLPRAVRGKRWYADKFGHDKIRARWAVLPGIV